MKKLLVMAAMVLSSVGAFAQQPVGTITIQPKIGLNCASATSHELGHGVNLDFDYKAGFVGGAEVEYQATPKLGISGGILYSMQGAKYSGNLGDLEGWEGAENVKDVKFNFDYLNIPVLANIYVGKGLALKAGVQFGFNINNKMKIGSISVNWNDLIDEIQKEEYYDLGGVGKVKTFDFSIPVGASYEYQNFVLDARYNIGVTKVIDGLDCRNSVFQLTLGYKFKL